MTRHESAKTGIERRRSFVRNSMVAGLASVAFLAAPPETAAASKETKTTGKSLVHRALYKLNHVKEHDSLPVLTGKTSNLVVGEGAEAFRYVGNKVKKFELKDDVEVLHGYTDADPSTGRRVIAFRLGQRSVAMSVAANIDHIKEIDVEGNKTRPFSQKDISVGVVPVDDVLAGFPFTERGAATDPLSTMIAETPVVPIAQGASTSPRGK